MTTIPRGKYTLQLKPDSEIYKSRNQKLSHFIFCFFFNWLLTKSKSPFYKAEIVKEFLQIFQCRKKILYIFRRQIGIAPLLVSQRIHGKGPVIMPGIQKRFIRKGKNLFP